MLRLFFNRRNWWTTLLVIAACGVMVRLGIWQLDRLEARRSFNARVQAQLDQPTLILNQAALDADLYEMEYRSVVVVGEYLHAEEIALRNRVWGNYPGVSLVTPLRIAGMEQVVLVERGWIPTEAANPSAWEKYNEPGQVEIVGAIRRSSPRGLLGGRPDPTPEPGEPLKIWTFLDIERISEQVTAPVLSVYIQQAADPNKAAPPYPSDPELDLSEGSHQGYAGQWFLFATMLGLGYPFFLRRQSKGKDPERVVNSSPPLTTEESRL
jgi:surfeit locus 1 family protein